MTFIGGIETTTEPTFKQKCLIMAVPCLMVWGILFGLSMLLNSDQWWMNALITGAMVAVAGFSVTTMDGSEYDPDIMP